MDYIRDRVQEQGVFLKIIELKEAFEFAQLVEEGEWERISYIENYLTEDFIREHHDKVMWDGISRSQTLSESFIREFQDEMEWSDIVCRQVLSEDFMREFQDNFDRYLWESISDHQVLSEEFIIEFEDKLSWYDISRTQVLSEDFIATYGLYVEWGAIFKYQTLSNEFKEMFSFKKKKTNRRFNDAHEHHTYTCPLLV